jgi:dipeptidase E
MNSLVEEADVVVISGGNTLFATDRWHRIGLVPLLRDAMQRGTVLTGGSAGAICWFDAGHSDSWDPDSYKQTMAKAFEPAEGEDQPTDEASVAPGGDEKAKPWSYIRCPCLGFLPGLVCPHHDKVQSNGVLRAADFDGMLKRHPGERGICIDHFAALVVKGDSFSVLSLEGRPGSVLQGGAYSEDQAGVPGVWQKDVAVDGTIDVQLVPPEGKLVDLLKLADSIVEDPNVLTCRAENPDPE